MKILHELEPRSEIWKRENLSPWKKGEREREKEGTKERKERHHPLRHRNHLFFFFASLFRLLYSLYHAVFYHSYRHLDCKRHKESLPLFFSFPATDLSMPLIETLFFICSLVLLSIEGREEKRERQQREKKTKAQDIHEFFIGDANKTFLSL